MIIENQKDNNERFDAIDKLIIENQKDNNARFDAIDNEIKTVKADVNSVKKDVKNLDIKLNKVIELNNLEF